MSFNIDDVIKDLDISQADIALRKKFLELNEQDLVHLHDMHALAELHAQDFARNFYEHILDFAELNRLISDHDKLTALKKTQSQYFSELTLGNYGEDYVRNRLKVGLVHRTIEMKPKWYFGAYYKYLSYYLCLLHEHYQADSQKFLDSFLALLKIVCFDMGLAMDTYIYADNKIISVLDKRLKSLVEGIDAIVIETDWPSMRFTYVSPQFQDIFGYPADSWTTRQDFLNSSGVFEDYSFVEYSCQQLEKGVDHELTYRIKTADYKLIWVHENITMVRDHDVVTGFRSIIVDISKLKETEDRLKYLASHDELTCLPNRATLNLKLQSAFQYADRNQKLIGVLFIDIDRFKNINDSLGHHIGDQVLQIVTDRLRKSVRDIDTIARIGGDEFVMIINDIRQPDVLASIAKNLLDILAVPMLVDGVELVVTASIGISIYPLNGNDCRTLLRQADIAMYRAKEKGRNCWDFFASEMNEAVQRRLLLENSLRNAIKNQEFVLFYQPQLDLETRTIIGVESLVRWQCPKNGLVLPNEFIPIAEETGLIDVIGLWILETACTQAVAWQQAGYQPIRMGINISARQLKNINFIPDVKAIIKKTGINPKCLEFELTESILITESTEIKNCIFSLRELGAGLSIDDFGTGYSSLAYLNRYPVSTVKIDKSFINEIPNCKTSTTLTKTIITMCQQMDLQVIAEGVESEVQLNFLDQHGCNEIQGYFIGYPVCANDMQHLLANHKWN